MKSRSKRGKHLNLIKAKKRRRTRTKKHKNLSKTMMKLDKPFNYRSFNKKLTKKDDENVNKPKLKCLKNLIQIFRTKFLYFAYTQSKEDLDASVKIASIRTIKKNLIKSKPFNYRRLHNRLKKKDGKSKS